MKFFASKKKQIFSLFILILLGVFVFYSKDVFAGSGDGMIDSPSTDPEETSGIFLNAFMGVINWLLGAILYFFGLFLQMAVWLLKLMLSEKAYSEVFFSPKAIDAVNLSWSIVRDFLNMFFILALILVAISKILRLSKFGDEKIFFNIIAGALLINFSKAITLLVIDASQLAMNFFADALSGTFLTLLLEGTGVGDTLKVGFSVNGNPEMEVFVGLLFAIIFVFVLAMMLFVLALALVYRFIAFWVLIILSPLAFFGFFFPGAKGFAGNWQSKLVNWAFFGPVMLFFVMIASYFISAVNFASRSLPKIQSGNMEGAILGILEVILPYITAIYFLWYGLDVSKKMANAAGSSVGGVMDWAGKNFSNFVKIGAGIGTVGAYPWAINSLNRGQKGIRTGLSNRMENAQGGLGKTARFVTGGGFTEESRKKYKEEKQEKSNAFWGGDRDDYYRKKALEQKKTWDNDGDSISNDTLRGHLRGGDTTKARAAALKLAERGELKYGGPGKNDFTEAIKAMGKDKNAIKQLRDTAKKKNMHAIIEHDIADSGARDRILDEAIEAEKTTRIINGSPALTLAEETAMRSDYENTIYNHTLSKMKLGEIVDQDDNLHKEAKTISYMQDSVNPVGGRFKKHDLRRKIGADGNALKAAIWQRHSII